MHDENTGKGKTTSNLHAPRGFLIATINGGLKTSTQIWCRSNTVATVPQLCWSKLLDSFISSSTSWQCSHAKAELNYNYLFYLSQARDVPALALTPVPASIAFGNSLVLEHADTCTVAKYQMDWLEDLSTPRCRLISWWSRLCARFSWQTQPKPRACCLRQRAKDTSSKTLHCRMHLHHLFLLNCRRDVGAGLHKGCSRTIFATIMTPSTALSVQQREIDCL